MENNQETNTPQEVIENTPVQEPCCGKEPKKQCKCCHIIITSILFLGLIGIYVLHFIGTPNKPKTSIVKTESGTVAIDDDGVLKIAYINTDTLMANYTYAKEVQAKVEQLSNQQASIAQQEAQFQADYENYLKTGENLTLSQQQEKEKELKARYEKLQRLEQQFTAQMPQKQKTMQDELDKMTKAVYNFIADYNAKHDQYDLILSKSYSSSPVLYGDPGMDITDEILKGLNEEYEQVSKGKK